MIKKRNSVTLSWTQAGLLALAPLLLLAAGCASDGKDGKDGSTGQTGRTGDTGAQGDSKTVIVR